MTTKVLTTEHPDRPLADVSPDVASHSEMVLVKPQPFRMGADDGSEAEQPVHEVALSPFWLDAAPVTNSEFARFVAATGYETTAEKAGAGWALENQIYRMVPCISWQTFASDGREDHPVILVSWHDAAAFATWCGKRLPSEAEWEYAARAGSEVNVFPWGSDEPDQARCGFPRGAGAIPGTSPVKAYLPNALGLFDMVGNVWQWCQDWYSVSYYASCGMQVIDPQGPETGELKVRRGGAWNVIQSFRLRCANRGAMRPGESAPNLGFRCAAPASEQQRESRVDREPSQPKAEVRPV